MSKPDIDIEIPKIPLSPNRLVRLHWRQKHKINKAWNLQLLAQRPLHHNSYDICQVEITRGYKDHPLDHDNLISSFKPVLDALVRNGYIKDDNIEVIRAKHLIGKQLKQKAKERVTRIRIWDLSNG